MVKHMISKGNIEFYVVYHGYKVIVLTAKLDVYPEIKRLYSVARANWLEMQTELKHAA